MREVFQQILAGATGASAAEQVATVLGVIFVWLAMRESLWNFPVGLVQAAIFGWVCFEGKLYSETVLQVVFMVAMIYGWWHWTQGGRAEVPLARILHALLASEATFWARIYSAFPALGDIRAKVKTAWRFCFSPHEPHRTEKTPPKHQRTPTNQQRECEICGLAVQRLSRREAVAWGGATLGLWVAWGGGMAGLTDAALPWGDGFVFATSVVSQWLQARKLLENWIGWIIANTAGIGVFWAKGLYWFAALYFLFWLMAWGGLRAWRRSGRTAHG